MKGYSEWLKEQSYLRKALGEGFNPITEGYNVDYDNVFKIIGRLEEPTKVVVPKFVAEWYEKNEDDLELEIFNLVTTISEKDYYELTELEAWFNNLGNEPIEKIMKMKLFGYEVEKEKLYYVINDTQQLMLANIGYAKPTLIGFEFVKQVGFLKKYQLTEKEIKEYDERYWTFAVEVTE